LTPKHIEAEARRLLRDQIARSAWVRNGLSDREQSQRIEQEVATFWHLKAAQVQELLEERARPVSHSAILGKADSRAL
jgi:hypothetical protein